MTRAYGTGDRAKATATVSRIIRRRAICERCHKTGVLYDHAHIVRRGLSWVRTDERNGWCLCKPCHYLVDHYPDEFNTLIERTCGWDLYFELKHKGTAGVRQKFDWSTELARLQMIEQALTDV